MSKEEILELIKNKPHISIYEDLFTKNMFGEVVRKQGTDIAIDENEMVSVITTVAANSFLDSITTANHDVFKTISKTGKAWKETADDFAMRTPFKENSIFHSNYDEKEKKKEKEIKKALKPELLIDYKSCNLDKENYNINFEINAKNLSVTNARIYVNEIDGLSNDEAVPKTDIQINKNGITTAKLSFFKSKNFTEAFFDDGNSFKATIICDGLSAETSIFKLNCVKPKEDENCKKIKVPTLKLTDEQKSKFIATVLCETALGNEKLSDIAWVYYNRVNLKGFDNKAGMKASSAFRLKQPDYKLCSYYLGVGEEYAGVKYGNFTIKSYVATGEFKKKYEQNFKILKKFIENNIFSKTPETCFKDWIGQGYWGDLDLDPEDPNNETQDPKWYEARQYYWLQLESKVKTKYVHIMRAGKATSFIFDEVNIAKFFKSNPRLLPESNKVKKFRNKEGFLNFDL